MSPQGSFRDVTSSQRAGAVYRAIVERFVVFHRRYLLQPSINGIRWRSLWPLAERIGVVIAVKGEKENNLIHVGTQILPQCQ